MSHVVDREEIELMRTLVDIRTHVRQIQDFLWGGDDEEEEAMEDDA